MSSARTFESKRDLWIVLVIWFSVAAMVAAGIAHLNEPGSPAGKGGILLLLLAAAAFALWVLYGTRYVVDGEWLRIYSGPVRYRIPIAQIQSVTPSRLALSSPACSLDRLKIRYHGGRRTMLVSPENKRDFLEALARNSTRLRREGNRLITAD